MIWEDWERLYDNEAFYSDAADLDKAIIENLEAKVTSLKSSLQSIKEIGDARMEGLLNEIESLKKQLTTATKRLKRIRTWGNIKTIVAVVVTAVTMGALRISI